jgi:amidohydrolase
MSRNLFSLVFAVALTGFTQNALAAETSKALREAISDDYDATLEDLFLLLHSNPELSHREFETATRLAMELRLLGYEVTEEVGGTGIVVTLTNGNGPTVMLRADMDALPVEEMSGLSYASTARQIDRLGEEQPVMHACGHDVHMTALIGTARQMITRLDEWSGTLVLIGQPAEETISGARAMLEDGLYERFPKPDYALAFHVSSSFQSGKVIIPLDVVGASADSVDIIVHGVGAHGASPHRGIDPVLVASQIVVSLQSVVSRTISPLEPGVITVGSIHGGTKHNIIGDRVEMQLTVRSDSFETRETLLNSIDRVADGVARSLGVPEELLPEVIRSTMETTPPTINDPETASLIRSAFVQNLGEDIVVEGARPGMGAEDFAYFVAPDTGVKGVYFNVGGIPEDQLETAASNHSPFFRIEPQPAIIAGVQAMVVGAITLMPN